MKSVSVIIPAYNSQDKINITIESLLSQTDLEFEIVFIDDGSTDKTYDIIRNTLKESQFSNYKIIQQKNMGVSVARNKGIEESENDYVYFLDADDYVSKKLIETLKIYINKNDVEVISWGYNEVRKDGYLLSNYSDSYEFISRKLTGIYALNEIIQKETLSIWTGSAIYSKSFLLRNNLKYTPDCRAGQDLEFIYKTLSKAENVIFIDKILSYYVRETDSTTTSYNIRKFDAVFGIKRVANYFRKSKVNDFYKLADYLEKNIMPIHYRFNFISSYKQLEINNDFLNIKKMKYFKSQIKKIYPNYPSLDKDMRHLLFNAREKNFKSFMINKIFAISPLIYMNLSDLRKKIS